jgi:hypothetical protein
MSRKLGLRRIQICEQLVTVSEYRYVASHGFSRRKGPLARAIKSPLGAR